ncbi:MAG: phosphoribosylanthranilate isomerase [Melioribacteraceae bacterium]|nr:phosphoribosylanthranilate isomerase [Melioribacteraceae bacterium]
MKKIIQAAGIIDIEEARMLMDLGVEYLGFPLRLPVNKEDLTENEAAEVIKEIKLPHKAVLITYLCDADEIIALCDKLNVRIVQLHGNIEIEELKKLKALRPDIEVLKSLVVYGNNLKELETTVNTLSQWVDLFITDTFDPVTGASGATGKTHDWRISRRLIEISTRPVIIAGGLNPSNVKNAILATKPAGVDVHTGIEAPNGRKDLELTRKFIRECMEAFKLI